ncbi:MAG TPA: YdaS family helix-turn-helix protein [Burkholderiales bacterium]|nr:YdaS family helix-turn-helix protein [Burkholderiales bacterium]
MEKLGVPKDECPVAPPTRVTVHTRVLHRACQILGGVEKLAKHLGVSVNLVHRWLDGDDVPPSRIFLKAIDLILPTWGPEDDALARAIAATRPKKN